MGLFTLVNIVKGELESFVAFKSTIALSADVKTVICGSSVVKVEKVWL
jgi:hypothetical protein